MEPTLYDDTYTGPRYRYGLRMRPPSLGAVPGKFLVGSHRESAEYRHGTLDYPREMTEHEVSAFELTPLGKVA